MLLAKKWGILIKKKPESLVFAGLEISRDYYILLRYLMDIQMILLIILLFIFIIIPILIFVIKTGVKKGILEAYSILKDK